MIEFDYILKRNEGSRIRTFKPKSISSPIPNLVSIEGPNGFGKSFLLHLLALGFFGLKKKPSLHPSLKHKIQDLLDDSYHKLSFKFKIKAKINGNNIEFISEKKENSSEVILRRKIEGKKEEPLSYETFESEYNLIYDIPNDPSERIKELVFEIEAIQHTTTEKTIEFHNFIDNNIREIQGSGKSKLKEYKKELSNLRKDEERLEEEQDDLKNTYSTLKETSSFNFFQDYQSKKTIAEEELNLINKTKKTKENTYKRKKEDSDTNHKILTEEFTNLTIILSNIKNLAEAILDKKNDNLKKAWNKIDLQSIRRNLKFDPYIDVVVVNTRDSLNKLLEIENKDENNRLIELVSNLVPLLEKYSDCTINIPGLDIKIPALLTKLQTIINNNEAFLKRKHNIEEMSNLVDKFFNIMNSLNELFPKIETLNMSLKDGAKEYYDELVKKEHKDSLNEQIEEFRNLEKLYYDMWTNLGQKQIKYLVKMGEGILKKYAGFTEDQIKYELSRLNNSIKETEDKSKLNEKNIFALIKEIKRIESEEPNKYHDKLDSLIKIESVVANLRTKFQKDFKIYAEEIKNKENTSYDGFSPDKKNYFQSVFKFLGSKVSFILYEDKEYKISSIDYIKGMIFCDDGTNIKLISLSTGQNQSAYLFAKLNVSDDRPLIVLFDEVAMMDAKKKKPILDKLKDLNKKGKLIAGIFVNAGPKIKISQL